MKNKDAAKVDMKEYYENNRSPIKLSQNKYYEHNKDAKKQSRNQRYEENKDAKKLNWKQHYEKNKDAKQLSKESVNKRIDNKCRRGMVARIIVGCSVWIRKSTTSVLNQRD